MIVFLSGVLHSNSVFDIADLTEAFVSVGPLSGYVCMHMGGSLTKDSRR